MRVDFSELKDNFVSFVGHAVDELKIKKKLKKCEEKASGLRKELSKKMKSLDLKNKSLDLFGKRKKCGSSSIKKVNPVTAVFLVLGGIAALFCSLVAFFYGFYSLVHKKRTSGYVKVPFVKK